MKYKNTWVDKNVGNKFGLLTILRRGENRGRHTTAVCHCECGTITEVRCAHLKTRETQSCGCFATLKLKGFNCQYINSQSNPTYSSWVAMKTRCTNAKQPNYKYYGGRGISVCKDWLDSYDNFIRDMGPRPEGKTLDRIDPDGNYEPGNCRWATPAQQTYNRRCTI